jgi:hypothetical protein
LKPLYFGQSALSVKAIVGQASGNASLSGQNKELRMDVLKRRVKMEL